MRLLKVGDLVTVDGYLYPRLKGAVGILVRNHHFGGRECKWIVHIGGRLHPYAIDESDMELHSAAT